MISIPIRLVLVWLIVMFPSGVFRMCRMMPTPDGIAQRWNFSVFGSKRSSASGRRPDSF
jgi:hypothetical protein